MHVEIISVLCIYAVTHLDKKLIKSVQIEEAWNKIIQSDTIEGHKNCLIFAMPI